MLAQKCGEDAHDLGLVDRDSGPGVTTHRCRDRTQHIVLVGRQLDESGLKSCPRRDR